MRPSSQPASYHGHLSTHREDGSVVQNRKYERKANMLDAYTWQIIYIGDFLLLLSWLQLLSQKAFFNTAYKFYTST